MTYFLESLRLRAAWKRCTAGWHTVHTGIAVNAPPIANVQNEFRTVGSGLKLERKLF